MEDVEIETSTLPNNKKRSGRIKMPSLNYRVSAAIICTVILFIVFQFHLHKNKFSETTAKVESTIQVVRSEWLNKFMNTNSSEFLEETIYNVTKKKYQLQLLFYPDNYQTVKNYMFIFQDPHLQNFSIGHFKKVYTNKDGLVVNENGMFPGRKRSAIEAPVVSYFEKAIVLGYTQCDFYVDFLGPLLLFNFSVIKSSIIIIDKYFPVNILTSLGFDSDKLAPLEKDQFVYCSELYTIYKPDTKHAYYWTLPLLNKNFVSMFNLSNIQPIRNVIINSFEGSAQYIKNWEKLLSNLNATLPQKNWQIDINNNTKLESVARCWASYLIVITSDGSILPNCIFMNTDSTIVELHSLQISNVHMMYTQGLGLEHICIRAFTTKTAYGLQVYVDNVINGVLSSKNAYI